MGSEGRGKGCPSMSCPTITDRLATTVVNSMEDMSSMHPSDNIISTGLPFSFSFSFSFQFPPELPLLLSFTTSTYLDRLKGEAAIISPCQLNVTS